jgi:hypothetical protein
MVFHSVASRRLHPSAEGDFKTEHIEQIDQLVEAQRRLASLNFVHKPSRGTGEFGQFGLPEAKRAATCTHLTCELLCDASSGWIQIDRADSQRLAEDVRCGVVQFGSIALIRMDARFRCSKALEIGTFDLK